MAQGRLALSAWNYGEPAACDSATGGRIGPWQSIGKTVAPGHHGYYAGVFSPRPYSLALLPDVLPGRGCAVRGHFGAVGRILDAGNIAPLATVGLGGRRP